MAYTVPGVAAGCHGAIPHSKPPFFTIPVPSHGGVVADVVAVVVSVVLVGSVVVGMVLVGEVLVGGVLVGVVVVGMVVAGVVLVEEVLVRVVLVGLVTLEVDVVVLNLGWHRQTELNLFGHDPHAAAARVGKPVLAVFILDVNVAQKAEAVDN